MTPSSPRARASRLGTCVRILRAIVDRTPRSVPSGRAWPVTGGVTGGGGGWGWEGTGQASAPRLTLRVRPEPPDAPRYNVPPARPGIRVPW